MADGKRELELRFDLSHFQIDWNKRKVSCPQGKKSRSWKKGFDSYGNPLIHLTFDGIFYSSDRALNHQFPKGYFHTVQFSLDGGGWGRELRPLPRVLCLVTI